MYDDPIDILKTLVGIRSLSGDEKEIAYVIRDYLGANGVDKAFIDGYGNVIGILRGYGNRKIVFEGHMDVVPPGDLRHWRTPPFRPVMINDSIYGRGTSDMKGAIAGMLSSITMVKKPVGDIYLVFVPYEEVAEGIFFGKAVDETLGIIPDLVVLGEATKLNVYRGHRGRAVIKIDIEGVPAHASMPELAVNPIESLANIITRINSLKLPAHKLLGRSSLTPTIIQCSPKSPPMIPDHCEIIVDYRMIPSESENEIISRISNSIRDVRGFRSVDYIVGDLRTWTGRSIRAKHYFPSWIYTGKLSTRALRIASKYNVGARFGFWRFSTDGVYSAGIRSIPTIGIGPGNEELAHKPNEHISIKELMVSRRIYAEIMNHMFAND